MNSSTLNLATVEVKALVPARDFELSKRFYAAAGFTMAFSSEQLAYFRHGDCSFLLQNFYVKELAENFVMHLLVENVEHWHEHVSAQSLFEQFGVRIGAPADRPWAMRDFTFLDPSGVLWRVAQNIPRVEAT